MADDWAEGNFAQRAIYERANSFSIVGQSMNPFNNQVTSLSGYGLRGTDRPDHGYRDFKESFYCEIIKKEIFEQNWSKLN